MWKPDLLLYNSANEAFDATFPTNVIVKSDGSVSQIPPGQQQRGLYEEEILY
jgi:nicotinic acetylcholine receptor